MSDDITAAEKNYRTFIEQAVTSGKVWGLKDNEGWVVSAPDDTDDASDSDEGGVMPFWSSKELAEKLIKDEWAGYQAESIELAAFLEDWIGGMVDDELLVGANWDADLFGVELDPLELALELITEIKKQGTTVSFVNYDDLADYETNVREVLGEELSADANA